MDKKAIQIVYEYVLEHLDKSDRVPAIEALQQVKTEERGEPS